MTRLSQLPELADRWNNPRHAHVGRDRLGRRGGGARGDPVPPVGRHRGELATETRDRLVALYRKSLSNLGAAQANADTAAAYRGAAETAPAQIALLRAARAEALADDPLAALDASPDASLAELERRLQEERADLAAVQARHDDLVTRLAIQQARPGAVRQRLSEADAGREAAYAGMQAETTEATGKGHPSALAEARRWELETRYQALSTEIRMLDGSAMSRLVSRRSRPSWRPHPPRPNRNGCTTW